MPPHLPAGTPSWLALLAVLLDSSVRLLHTPEPVTPVQSTCQLAIEDRDQLSRCSVIGHTASSTTVEPGSERTISSESQSWWLLCSGLSGLYTLVSGVVRLISNHGSICCRRRESAEVLAARARARALH